MQNNNDPTSAERNRRYRRRRKADIAPVQIEVKRPSLVALHDNGLDEAISEICEGAIALVNRALSRLSSKESAK